jgi:hypothetical protein
MQVLVFTVFTWAILSGCSTTTRVPTHSPGSDCNPWTDNSFIGPARPNPAWRAGGLQLGDVAAKRKASRRTLKAPPGWDCPDTIDNSEYCTPLEDQGSHPWCAAFATGQLLSASYWREFHHKIDFPEEKLYRLAKQIEGNDRDGTTLEDILLAAGQLDYGLPVQPSFGSLSGQQVWETEDVLFALHKYGLVLVGLDIQRGWQELNKDGSIGPAMGSLGGHGVLVSGYSRRCNAIWGPNWWGKNWGKGGWWYMSLDQFKKQFIYGYAVKITWEKKQ